MPSQPSNVLRTRRLIACGIVLSGVLLSALATARIVKNTVNPTATLTDNGRQIVVTGPISCTGDQPVAMKVTVTQRSTGAVATGIGRIDCSTGEQQWEIRAVTAGDATFVEGAATAVAFARASDGRTTDDAHQWLVEITLVR
jgi:hypothetical protein